MASTPVTAPSLNTSESPPAPPTSSSPPPSTPAPTTGPSSTPPPDPSSEQSTPPPTSSPAPPTSSSPPPKATPASPPPTTIPSSSPPKSTPSSPPTITTPAAPPPKSPSSPPTPTSSGNSSSSQPPSSSGSNSSPPAPPTPSSEGSFSPPPSSSLVPSRSSSSSSSPPPPPRSSSKSSSKDTPSPSKEAPSKSSSSSSPSSSSSGIDIPLVLGVTAGIAAFFILMVLVFLCCTKKKKRRPHDSMQYYGDPPRKTKGNEYYNPSPHWHNVSPNDHVVKVPPPPGALGHAGGGGWGVPPPPMMHSSDMSSTFSGPHGAPLPPPSPGLALGFNKNSFSYEELAAATSGFSQSNLLGHGGFGYVYKGVLPNGQEVAVKQLKSGSGQGEREFQAEVEIISRVHHRHLVSLVGYCIAGAQRMLVYEFVPNNTLEYHLHGRGRPTMDFPTRLKITLGSAKGLAYLHEYCHPKIIHRDIKTANILLDYKFEAMVADFGLAKLSSDNYTHVSTRIMGTFGYLAPEYASSGKLTEKSDVFSFGVMLLELITGRRPVDNNIMEDSLVDWAKPLLNQSLEDGNFSEVADPHLEGNYNPNEMARMVACAAASVRHSAKRRPKMSQIVRALEGDSLLEDLNDGARVAQSSMSSGSSDYESGSYSADMRKFRKMALDSEQMGSSGFSGPTSEYGLNPSSSSSGSCDPNSTTLRPNTYAP